MEYVILILALAAIVCGANYLVDGSVSIAKRFGVSDFIVGATIVGIGTSMPELVVSLAGALKGNPDVAIGNVVGSNVFNVLGILGLTALFAPVAVDRKNLRFEIPYCLSVSILLTVLASDGISHLDGLVLLVCFVAFLWFSMGRGKSAPTFEGTSVVNHTTLWLPVAKVTGGLFVLVMGSNFFVDSAVQIAHSLGVEDAFISLTLIACGTSLPELAASVAAALKKNTQMAIGNIVGSNVFNITGILGLSSLAIPLTASGVTMIDYVVMTAASVLLLLFGVKGGIGRIGGAFMFVCFLAYNWYLLNEQLQLA